LQFGTITLPKSKILVIVAVDAKLINAKIDMDPKISSDIKIGTNESFFISPTH
jgi:hypothetical protein